MFVLKLLGLGPQRTAARSTTSRRDKHRSVAMESIWTEGRRFQNIEHCPYLLPNDVTELNRLEIEHQIMREVFGGIFIAPVHQMRLLKALDVGCAQGTWVLEAASEFPKCRITGIDISSVYPSDTMPPNCLFEFGNIVEGLKYPDGEFDYVHQRGFAFAVRLAEWPQVCRELVRVTAPRGVIEIVDTCLPFTGPGAATAQVNAWIDAACAQQGIEVRSYLDQIPRMLRQAGVSNIHITTRKLPAGRWAGRVGELGAQCLYEGARILCKGAPEAMKLPVEEFDAVLERFREEMETIEYEVGLTVMGIWGQRTMSGPMDG